MPDPTSLAHAASSLRSAVRTATSHLVDRDTVAELMLLAAVAREHLLLIGPPGTAKSAVVRRVAHSFGGQYFEYLLGRFTEPSELFGPIDLRRLREGVVETETAGMLPEADVAFLDEVFLGSTAILNTLLGVLNERRFRRGASAVDCPLKLCVAAANAMPEEPMLAAFADRFLLHVFIAPVADHALEQLLTHGRAAELESAVSGHASPALDTVINAARAVQVEPVRPLLAEAIRALRRQHIALSDRRIVKAQQLVAAAAALAGRLDAQPADLWPLVYVLPSAGAQASGRELLAPWLEAARNTTLQSACEAASGQPLARLPRLLEQAAALKTTPLIPAIESWLKEVDSSFERAQLPAELGQVRSTLLVLLRGDLQRADSVADAQA